MPLPPLDDHGELPPGVHTASVQETLEVFGGGTLRRRVMGQRLERCHDIARSTGCLHRFVIFGSFVTDKPEPNDVDLFMIMDDAFDVAAAPGEAAVLFDHQAADTILGVSAFWVRKVGALGGEDEAISYWQITRKGTDRGIVEIVER
jgi:hypothetical protein